MPGVKAGESRSSYMARCVPYVMKNEGLTNRQAVGKCEGMYSQARKGKMTKSKELPFGIKLVVLEKAKKGNRYLNPDGTFKGGFDGCVRYQMSKGKSKEAAQKICAYIGRRAGKIPG